VSSGAHNADPTKWSLATIIVILKKEEYMGWKVLNKTTKDNYKSKRREKTAPENKLIFKDAHQLTALDKARVILNKAWHP